MRRLEFLITEVRNSTDNTDVNGVKTPEIVGYFNAAQRYIETLIFKNNPQCDLFKTQVEFSATSDGIYTLPTDCLSVNAISMVEGRYQDSGNNKGYSRIKPISEIEFAYAFGYISRDNKILISGQNNVTQLTSVRITYFKQLPSLDVRQGKVVSVVPGVSITLPVAPTDLYLMDDHASAVDYLGNQFLAGIYFTNTSGVSLLTATTTGITTAHYIVAGKNSVNQSQLPLSCETYLLDYVKQRIYTRNNYEDSQKQIFFTEQQREEIISIFSKKSKDDDNVPITDIAFLNF